MGELGSIDPDRTAEVLVTSTRDGSQWRGSGYRITATAVLTAAHVVADANSVLLRFNARRADEWVADATVAWSNTLVDAAVLTIEPLDDSVLSPVLFGRVADRDAIISCRAMGFPLFKLRADTLSAAPDKMPSSYRDSHHAVGTIAVLSNRKEGTFEITVPPPERDPDPEQSAWQGMSGAAVWSAGRLIGVVQKHYRRDGPGRLTATRVDRWPEVLNPPDIEQLGQLIHLPTGVSDLVDVVPPRDKDSLLLGLQVNLRALFPRPSRPDRLFGRDHDLRSLRQRLHTEHFRVLTGLAGIGKTSLALEYSYNYAADYDFVIWVEAERSDVVYTKCAQLCNKADILSMDPPDTIRSLLSEGGFGRWLAIFDNADNRKAVQKILPSPGPCGDVIVTTKNSTWERPRVMQPLDILTDDAVKDWVEEFTSKTEPSLAHDLATELGGLPLALMQAVSYINATNITIQEYLHLFRSSRVNASRLLNYYSPVDHPTSIVNAICINLDQLENDQSGPVRLLEFLSLVAPDRFPRLWLHALAARIGVLQPDELIARLRNYSLVMHQSSHLEPDSPCLGVHRVVQMVVRDRMLNERLVISCRTIVDYLNESRSTEPGDQTNLWWAIALPHILAVESAVKMTGAARLQDVELLLACSHAHRERFGFGLFECAELALDLSEFQGTNASVPPGAMFFVARARGELAACHHDRGQVDSAIKILSDALNSVRGPVPDPARRLVLAQLRTQLGQALRERGQVSDLHASRRQFEAAFSELAPDVADGQLLLMAADIQRQAGQTVREQGLLEEALSHLQRAEQLVERISSKAGEGVNALSLEIRRQIAWTFRESGKLDEAERLLRESLALAGQTAAADWRRGRIYRQLGWTLREQGRLEEAKQCLEDAKAAFECVQGGPRHWTIARVDRELGPVLRELGRSQDCRELLEQSYELHVRAFGPRHWRVAEVLRELAPTLRDQGDLAGAKERLYEAQQILGNPAQNGDWRAARISRQLGPLLGAEGDLDTAESLLWTAKEIYARTFGERQWRTAELKLELAKLARLRYSQSRDGDHFGQAQRYIAEAERVFIDTFGSRSWRRALCLFERGVLLGAASNNSRAAVSIGRALDINMAVYKRPHYSIVACHIQLGKLLMQDKQSLPLAANHVRIGREIAPIALGSPTPIDRRHPLWTEIQVTAALLQRVSPG